MKQPSPNQFVAIFFRVAALAALAGILAATGYVYRQSASSPAATISPHGEMTTLSEGADLHADRADGPLPFLDLRSADDFVRLRPGDEALVSEPAGLPLYPTDGRQRQAGFRRREGSQVEEMAIWRLPGASVEQVQQFYENAARRLGFSPQESAPPARATTTAPVVRQINRLYIRVSRLKKTGASEPSAREVLIVRAWLGDAEEDAVAPRISGARGVPGVPGVPGVRVMLWFRYSIADP